MNDKIHIALVADYEENRPSHVATENALRHTADILSIDIEFDWCPTKPLETNAAQTTLDVFDGIWGAPGIPVSSLGYINAIQHSREKRIPYLGT